MQSPTSATSDDLSIARACMTARYRSPTCDAISRGDNLIRATKTLPFYKSLVYIFLNRDFHHLDTRNLAQVGF